MNFNLRTAVLGWAIPLAACAPQLPPASKFLADQVVDMPPIVLRSPQGAGGAADPLKDPNAAFVALTMEVAGIADGTLRVVRPEPFGKPDTLACPGLYCLKLPHGVVVQARVELWSANASGQPGEPLARGRTLPFVAGHAQAANAAQAYLVPAGSFAPAVSSDGAQATLAGRVGIGAALVAGNPTEAVLVGGAVIKPDAVDVFAPASLVSFSGVVSKYTIVQRQIEQSAQTLALPRAFAAVATGASVVAIIGGYVAGVDGPKPTNTIEYLDKSGTLRAAKETLKFARAGASIAPMFAGQDYFLVLAGHGDSECTTSCAANTWEIWHPQLGIVTTGNLVTPRWRHAMVQLPGPAGGYAMLVGGENGNSIIGTAEVVQWSASANGVVSVSRAGAKCDDKKADECAALPNFYWSPQQVPLPSARTWPGAALVRSLDGSGQLPMYVTVFGGFSDLQHTKPLSDLHVFPYATGAFLAQSLAVGPGRAAPLFASVEGGRYGQQLLVAGGVNAQGVANADAAVFLVQPDATAAASMVPKTAAAKSELVEGGRVLATALALPTGHILVAGGVGGGPGAWVARTKVLLWGAF